MISFRYDPSPRPTLAWSMLTSRGQPDFNIISLSGGGQGEVFVVANALKSFILKLDMIESIFLKHFVEDCGFLVEAERMGD